MQTDIDNTKNIKGLNKSVLVTGCGYIGSNIAKDLYRNGYTPVVVGKSIQDSSISNFAECFEVDLPKDIHLLDEIVKRYSHNVIDIDNFTTPEEFDKCTRDKGGHPTVDGYKLLDKMIKSI